MARKIRTLEKDIDFGQYHLIVILYNRPNQATTILKDMFQIELESSMDDAAGFALVDHQYAVLALNNYFTVGDLIHELEHLTYQMLSRYSVEHSDNTDETYAMQLESLFRIVIQLLKDDKYKLPSL